MIDTDKLFEAYEKDGFYALQLEIGDVCYQNCLYCYMNALEFPQNQLTNEEIFRILREAKELGFVAIEWLGGEPLLRKEVFDFLEFARSLNFRNNMWTGGLPLADPTVAKNCSELCSFGLIAFHLSTLNPSIYEFLHPGRTAEDIKMIINGVENLISFGYPASQLLNSVTFTGYQTSEDMIETIEFFQKNYNISTCVNVYHTYLRPGQSSKDLEKFIPSAGEVEKVYSYLKKVQGTNIFPMNCVNKQYCSATIAVLNNGFVTPCATIREEREGMNIKISGFKEIVLSNKDYLIFKEMKNLEGLPSECQECYQNEFCFGCRSRAYAAGLGIYGEDPRCYQINYRRNLYN
ncbi:MAG: radical SAM protein [Ignavibacteria bacterium]|nr:radical SAM protein [Ignavibacteria bacterium]